MTIETYAYDQATYAAIMQVLITRELISETNQRLALYFRAKGVEISEVETAKSNIYIGGAL